MTKEAEAILAALEPYAASLDKKIDTITNTFEKWYKEERATHAKLDAEIADLIRVASVIPELVLAIKGFNEMIRKVLIRTVLALVGLSMSLGGIIIYDLFERVP